MSTNEQASSSDAARSTASAIERLALLHLRNRFVWLATALGLVLIGQLSYMQLRFDRFDTLTLMSHVAVMIEAALVAVALICALATPRIREAWYTWAVPRDGGRFSYFLSALAGNLTITCSLLLLLLPVLWLHRYPELLVTEHPISVPLMMLQRSALLLAAVLVTYHVTLILRYYLRLPWVLCALLGLAFHIALGYSVTYLSYTQAVFARLNDVFYYNQLWQYGDAFPKLQRAEIFHNIEQPYFSYYFGALLIWALTILLLVPQAMKLGAREKG
jgi:hypothetical protein